jgi:hypothetical protein
MAKNSIDRPWKEHKTPEALNVFTAVFGSRRTDQLRLNSDDRATHQNSRFFQAIGLYLILLFVLVSV